MCRGNHYGPLNAALRNSLNRITVISSRTVLLVIMCMLWLLPTVSKQQDMYGSEVPTGCQALAKSWVDNKWVMPIGRRARIGHSVHLQSGFPY